MEPNLIEPNLITTTSNPPNHSTPITYPKTYSNPPHPLSPLPYISPEPLSIPTSHLLSYSSSLFISILDSTIPLNPITNISLNSNTPLNPIIIITNIPLNHLILLLMIHPIHFCLVPINTLLLPQPTLFSLLAMYMLLLLFLHLLTLSSLLAMYM